MDRLPQDIVPKAPKFFIMYKRAGYRVIINHNGDMIVRPSAIEASVQVAGESCWSCRILLSCWAAAAVAQRPQKDPALLT